MADESILGQAVAMIPGMGKPKRGQRKSAQESYLSTIQKNLAELAHAVEKLGAMVTGAAASRPVATRRAKPRKAPAKRAAASVKRRSAAKRRPASATTRTSKRK
jgi:hypothetical protein